MQIFSFAEISTNLFMQVEAILILLSLVSKRTFNEALFLKKTQINYIRKCLQVNSTYETQQQQAPPPAPQLQQHLLLLTRAGLWYNMEVSTHDWTNYFPECKRVQFSYLRYFFTGKQNKIQRMAQANPCEHFP